MSQESKGKRWIKHYNSWQKILLVGEGDFSFSDCLAKAFGNAANMVATCIHSQEGLPLLHRTSGEHIASLVSRGCLVLYNVDVSIMSHLPRLKDMEFDVIVFNFPHAGHFPGKMHRNLVKAYFKSAREMVRKGGEIHVTVRVDEPYDQWEVEKLAVEEGLTLKERVEFDKKEYPGYHNKRGSYIKCNQTFPLNQCYTFKFLLKQTDDDDDKAVTDDGVAESAENCSSDVDVSSIITTAEDLHT